MASLPKLGGLPPPIFQPRSRALVTVDTARTGLPPPPPKARPKSLQIAPLQLGAPSLIKNNAS